MLLEPQFTMVFNMETEVLECVHLITGSTPLIIGSYISEELLGSKWYEWFITSILLEIVCCADFLPKHNVTYYSHQMRLS